MIFDIRVFLLKQIKFFAFRFYNLDSIDIWKFIAFIAERAHEFLKFMAFPPLVSYKVVSHIKIVRPFTAQIEQ